MVNSIKSQLSHYGSNSGSPSGKYSAKGLKNLNITASGSPAFNKQSILPVPGNSYKHHKSNNYIQYMNTLEAPSRKPYQNNTRIKYQSDISSLTIDSPNQVQIQILPDNSTRTLVQNITSEIIEIYKTCNKFYVSKDSNNKQEGNLSLPF